MILQGLKNYYFGKSQTSNLCYAKTILEAKVRIIMSQVTGNILKTKNEDEFCNNPSNQCQIGLKKCL